MSQLHQAVVASHAALARAVKLRRSMASNADVNAALEHALSCAQFTLELSALHESGLAAPTAAPLTADLSAAGSGAVSGGAP